MGAESIWLVDPIDGTKSFVRDMPVLLDADRADARRRARARRLRRPGLRRARLGGRGRRRVPRWRAGARQPRRASSRRRSSRPATSRSLAAGSRAGRASGRWCARVQPHARLRRFRALPPARARRARRGDRVRRQHPRHRRARRHRARGGRDASPICTARAVGLATTSVLATNAALHASVLAALRP